MLFVLIRFEIVFLAPYDAVWLNEQKEVITDLELVEPEKPNGAEEEVTVQDVPDMEVVEALASDYAGEGVHIAANTASWPDALELQNHVIFETDSWAQRFPIYPGRDFHESMDPSLLKDALNHNPISGKNYDAFLHKDGSFNFDLLYRAVGTDMMSTRPYRDTVSPAILQQWARSASEMRHTAYIKSIEMCSEATLFTKNVSA